MSSITLAGGRKIQLFRLYQRYTYEGVLRSFLAPPSHPDDVDYAMYARTRADHETAATRR